jgi:hypothetical protein
MIKAGNRNAVLVPCPAKSLGDLLGGTNVPHGLDRLFGQLEGQPEDSRARGTVFSPGGPEVHGGQGRLDRVGCTQVASIRRQTHEMSIA